MATEGSRFVWRELMTGDVARAVQFYTRLFGWKTEVMDMGTMKYTIVKNGDKQVGGIYQTPPEARGTPPNWLGYVSVDNVDGACEKAVKLGAKIMMPPMDIPNVGRWAVLTDPQGAAVAPFRGNQAPQPTPTRAQPGEFCWDELMTNDVAGAVKFYTQLFGWAAVEHDMGAHGKYTLFKKQGTEKDQNVPGLGGAMAMPKDAKHPPYWMHYIEHADVDKGAAMARELGGQMFVPPTDIPNIGRFSVFADPTGAHFALYKNAH
ncbi:MAG TPA: VOC family protein [Polyangia bacterium]|nr:VOC family protein [Polyangia bacterium]